MFESRIYRAVCTTIKCRMEIRMKLSVSNIAWTKEYDEQMYDFLTSEKIDGLEIAPTRIFPELPYDKLEDASKFAGGLKERYGLAIPSLQSIWFGRSENLFASEAERRILLDYTKKTIDFASAVGCGNLVFGCPRNRSYADGCDITVAVPFFEELGEYAYSKGTVLAMEANPPIYNTNYCNTTMEAVELIKNVASKGFLLNLDVGTMIQIGEDMHVVDAAREYLNHVHISEPGLAMPEHRVLHRELAKYLRETSYERFVSLEVKTQEDIQTVKDTMHYLQDVFA